MKRLAVIASGMLSLSALLPAAVVARYERWVPALLAPNTSGVVLLEVAVVPAVASAELTVSGDTTPRPLRDDGQQGDRVAGDRIFSLQFSADELRTRYQLNGAAKRHQTMPVGNARFLGSNGALLQSKAVNIPVRSDAIPSVAARSAGSVRFTPHVVNIRMPYQYFLKQDEGDFELEQVTQIFYQHFKDSFDALNLIFSGGLPRLRHYVIAQNSIQGIGLGALNLLPKWGSASALQGLFVAPVGPAFDTTQACAVAYLHEHAHRWINFLEGGMADPHGQHWPLGDMAGGIMGFSAQDGSGAGVAGSGLTVSEGNDLRFRPFSECPKYADLELYLMGLRSSSQVASHLVAVDQLQVPGLTIQGPFNTVSMQTVLTQNGQRVPSFANAPKTLRVGTILVTPDNFASADEMDWYENELVYAEAAFHHATGGAGRMATEVDTSLIGPPPFTVSTIHRIRNAASLASGPVAPGEIIRIDGIGLGPSARLDAKLLSGVPAPTSLGDISVLMNGVAIPLLAVQASQITAVMPNIAHAGVATAEFQVQRNSGGIVTLSNAVRMHTAFVSPAVFTRNGLGSGEAIAADAAGTPITAQNPAPPGSELVIVAQGLGPFSPALQNGSIVGPAAPPQLAGPVEVTVDGKAAVVLSAAAIEGDIANKVAIRFQLPFPVFGNVVQTQPFVYVSTGGKASQPGVRINVRLQ